MTRYIDREAGFATFRQGRSFCVRLDGTLDAAMARGIAERLGAERDAVRLRLECSTLADADADATRVLTSAVLGWARAGSDRTVDILNLDPAVESRIGWHPLQALTDPDELVFLDPDRDDPLGTPSRH
jgi:hypothetical protein